MWNVFFFSSANLIRFAIVVGKILQNSHIKELGKKKNLKGQSICFVHLLVL
jgi:hypothetical protein